MQFRKLCNASRHKNLFARKSKSKIFQREISIYLHLRQVAIEQRGEINWRKWVISDQTAKHCRFLTEAKTNRTRAATFN